MGGRHCPPPPRTSVSRSVAAALFAALALSACQDPAGVGLGLIDEEQSDPSVRTIPLGDLDTLQTATPAIGIALSTSSLAQARVLMGDVTDDVFGDARSVAYVDFQQPTIGDVEETDVTEVWLELRRDYAYGDTTTALPIALSEVEGVWDADRSYSPDTLFSTGPVLSTTTIRATADSLQRFDLPQSWVTANRALLVGERADFLDQFEGFALTPSADFAPAPGVVFGFRTYSGSGSALRVATADDTLSFPLSEVFSSVDITPPQVLVTDEVIPVRASSRASLVFTADLGDVPQTALARATVRLPLDESFARQGAFVRPIAPAAILYGLRLRGDGEEDRSVLGRLDVSGPNGALDNTRVLTDSLQAVLFDPSRGGYTRYEVLPLGSPTGDAASLSILPVTRPTPTSTSVPRLTLTLVGSTGTSATAPPAR